VGTPTLGRFHENAGRRKLFYSAEKTDWSANQIPQISGKDLFPFYGARWLGGYIIDYTIDAADLIYDPI
jgi:hypothetical protein